MKINYVCSLGRLCHTSYFFKENKLKKCSYPFDWIFSNYDNIIHCIEDNFKTFLNKSLYIRISENQCGHSYYHEKMWWHHNPLDNKEQYEYYVRCCVRFRFLLKNPDHKLFTMIYVNQNNIDEDMKDNIIEFNNKLSKYTSNYTLLIIFNIINKEKQYHNFTHNDNIHFLELHTLSSSNGIRFLCMEDNKYLDDIIHKKYNFDIKN